MSTQEYYLVAGGWFLLILLLSIFWYAALCRLAEVLAQYIKEKRTRETVPGLGGLFLYLFRGEFKRTGDARLKAVCQRLRSLLFAYLGSILGYIVFLVLLHPHR